MSIFNHCPGSKQIKTPYPEEIKCLCGQTVEIWSDETSATCKKCKRKVTREMEPTCLDWCSMAGICVGKEKYKQYLKNRKNKKGDD
ncbi:MAG: phosphohydrolase [Candidatus Omnitrophica bacterium]|nr:phosphohydrolase [Candidatus Omnitrophota bacterium]